MSVDRQADPTLDLPRILCLHGGGTNSGIFYSQCRLLRRQLEHRFRLCFAEGLFTSEAGFDVVAAYKDFGLFRRWLRWLPTHPPIKTQDAVDDAKGATGKWVAILGFSQGAKVAASILLRQKMLEANSRLQNPGGTFRFGILIAGRGPLVSLELSIMNFPALVDASDSTMVDLMPAGTLSSREHVLSISTIHFHGLTASQQIMERYCSSEHAKLVIYNGDHRVPIKMNDVAAVVSAIYTIAREV